MKFNKRIESRARRLTRFAIANLLMIIIFTSGGIVMAQAKDQRYQRGMAALRGLDAQAAQKVMGSLADIAPDMGRFIVEFAYGDIFSRPGLDPASREVATVAALAALGNAEPQLKFHLGAALNCWVTPRQLIEVMYVTTIFAGFPAGLNGISAAREVFQARGLKVEPAPALGGQRRRRGLKALEATSRGAGQAVLASLKDIAPEMGGFVLDFSYGDIIARQILPPQWKEIAMIAAAAARGTMRPQLKVHIKAGLQVGLTKSQIVELMYQMAVYAGFPAGLNGIGAAREVFAAGP